MNKIQLIENNTKKILESGFIEAFIEHYVEIKNIDETENTRLMYLMCNDIEEKKVVTLNQIDKTKSIIKDLGFSNLSYGFIDNMKSNLKLEKSYSWINRFADEFKDNIVNFQTVSYLFENTFNFKDERFTEEVKVALFQEQYEHDNYSKEKPLIKDVNILLEKEEELIEDILYLIEDYQKNEYWDIDILNFEHFRKYNTSIDTLFKLSELLFQLNQLSMYNEFLEIEKNEFSTDEKKVNDSLKINLIDDLLMFSNNVLKVNVLNYSKEQIINFDKKNDYSDYLDYENYVFQSSIIKADEKQINLILSNLERAIKTNCFNSIDLSSIELNENFNYSDIGETIPEDLENFRIQYLKYLVNDLRKIDFNIRRILNLPIVQHKEFVKTDIFKKFDDYSKFECDYLCKIKEVLNTDSDKLEIYFKEYLKRTDAFIQLFDEMQNTFYTDVGYLNNEDKKLKGILNGCKNLIISNFFNIINEQSINCNDKFILDRVIKDYEFTLKVYETKSNFIELIKDKLSEIVISNIENKLNDVNIHSIYIGEKMLHYLDSNSITIEEAALYCVYQSIEVDDKNCDEIITSFNNTSGRKLYQYFANYSNTYNRRNNNLNSKIKLKNRIKKILIILNLLDDNYKFHAEKDLEYLNEKLDSEYN